VCTGVLALFLASARAQAEPAEPAVDSAITQGRTEVVFGAIGLRAQPAQGTVSGMLTAELRQMGLVVVQAPATEPLSAWASEVTKSRRVLAAILLDVRSEQGWRVVVIDATRGRAIARSLPGGIREDAASIEAVVSIVASAASALHEGLEVASAPLSAIVGAPPEPPKPEPSKVEDMPLEGRVSEVAPERWAARATIGASLASFSPSVPATQGAVVALGLTFPAQIETRLFATLFAPPLIRGPLGDFRVARTFLGAAVGPVFRVRALSFIPEAGLVAERSRRFDAEPTEGVFATEPSALYRVGGSLALRLRHTLVRPLSVELMTGAMYFGRRLQFAAKSADTAWSEGAWPFVAVAQLSFEIATN